MKPGKMQPHGKLREVFDAHPGWYWDRHMCEVVLPSEVLAKKAMRYRRADWEDVEGGQIVVEEGSWLYYFICPIDDSDVETQRKKANKLHMERSKNRLLNSPFRRWAEHMMG